MDSRPTYTNQSIREAVSRFLRESSTANIRSYVRREVKSSIRDVINRILTAKWNAYLVGGTIRDMVLGPDVAGPGAYYPRDIDIIVVGVERTQIKELFRDLYVRDTRFGGAHLVDRKPAGLEVLYDVWSLEETWAFEAFLLPRMISEFPKTPFLNLDTAAVEIRSHRGKPRQVFENGFLDGINFQMMEMNFEPNPYPDICLVRALIMAAKLQFYIGPRLLEFIVRETRTISVERLMDAQQSHYGKARCSVDELSLWIRTLVKQADAGLRGRLTVTTERQLRLWNDYPQTGARTDGENLKRLVSA